MEEISDDRLLIVSELEMSEPKAAHIAALGLLTVMLYPEDRGKRSLHLLGLTYSVVYEQQSKKQGITFLRNHPNLASLLCYDKDQAIDNIRKTFTSRKKGHTGMLAARGNIAGHLMCYLAKPEIDSLEQTYKEYKDNPLQYKGDDISPSKSVLKKAWAEYRHVAHLWAALHIHKENHGDALFRGPFTPSGAVHPQAAVHFLHFLQIASFFRNKLIESLNISTQQPHIKDPLMVWDIATKDKSRFPPLQLLLK